MRQIFEEYAESHFKGSISPLRNYIPTVRTCRKHTLTPTRRTQAVLQLWAYLFLWSLGIHTCTYYGHCVPLSYRASSITASATNLKNNRQPPRTLKAFSQTAILPDAFCRKTASALTNTTTVLKATSPNTTSVLTARQKKQPIPQNQLSFYLFTQPLRDCWQTHCRFGRSLWKNVAVRVPTEERVVTVEAA